MSSIDYTIDGRTFVFDYNESKAAYENFRALNDEEFLKAVPEALHFACLISYFKGLGAECTVGDRGIVHRLVHLLNKTGGPDTLEETREQFNNLLKLS